MVKSWTCSSQDIFLKRLKSFIFCPFIIKAESNFEKLNHSLILQFKKGIWAPEKLNVSFKVY